MTFFVAQRKGKEAANVSNIFRSLLGLNCFFWLIFKESIIPTLLWVNDAQHLNITLAIHLETLLINSHPTIRSFIPKSNGGNFSSSFIIRLYFHKSYQLLTIPVTAHRWQSSWPPSLLSPPAQFPESCGNQNCSAQNNQSGLQRQSWICSAGSCTTANRHYGCMQIMAERSGAASPTDFARAVRW